MAKKKQNSNRLEKKQNYLYRVTAILICGECGNDVDKKIREFSGDFELDFNKDFVQEFFLEEMVKCFDCEVMNGDFVIIKIHDCQKKKMQIISYEYEDDCENSCCCNCE